MSESGLPCPIANFEIQNELQNNGVYSRNNLPKIKHETYYYIM